MGLRADGAAQAYTVLGGIVLIISSLGRIQAGLGGSSPDSLMELVLGIALLIVTILAFDASGLVKLTLSKSGLILALLGFVAILIVSYPGIIVLDIIAWLRNLETLAGFMLLLGGLIMAINK